MFGSFSSLIIQSRSMMHEFRAVKNHEKSLLQFCRWFPRKILSFSVLFETSATALHAARANFVRARLLRTTHKFGARGGYPLYLRIFTTVAMQVVLQTIDYTQTIALHLLQSIGEGFRLKIVKNSGRVKIL